jgi:hypothetical protein
MDVLMSFENYLPEGFESVATKKPYINLGKLPAGEYKFRIVCRPIAGWLDWHDRKPVRFRPQNKPKTPYDASKPVKSFWAVYVWDYNEEDLFVMEITQNSIKHALEELARNEDWGDLTTFDFKIKKTGMNIETNYAVTPIPHKPMDAAIKEALSNKPVRLEALYEGGDPWTDLVAPSTGINEKQSAQLKDLINKVNDKSFISELQSHLKVASLTNIAEQDFQRAINALETRIKSKPQEKHNEQRRMASVA